MAFSSTRNHLYRSGLRFPFQRTQFQSTQFVRSFWQKTKGRMQRSRTASLKEQIQDLNVRGFCGEAREDDKARGQCSIPKDPIFYKKLKIVGDQEQILSMVNELYIISDVKLTLGTKGLFSCLYEHGVEDTWRGFVETMKGKANTSYLKQELEEMEKWIDKVEPLAKEIYQVLVVCHRQKVAKPQGEFFPIDLVRF